MQIASVFWALNLTCLWLLDLRYFYENQSILLRVLYGRWELYDILVVLIFSASLALFQILLRSDPGSLPKRTRSTYKPLNPDRSCQYCLIEDDIGLTTHHCRRCNQCVPNFDHHCFFLDKDISSRNYVPFLAFILIESFLCFWSISRIEYVSLFAFILGYAFFMMGLSFAVLSLFHVYLCITGRYTWQMFKEKR